MARWPRGEADIERLVGWGISSTSPAQPWMVRPSWSRRSALWQRRSRSLPVTPTAPSSSPVTPRYAATALLAHQGLLPTTAGGHLAVEPAIRAQFGEGFRSFGFLRRRRNELAPAPPVPTSRRRSRPSPSPAAHHRGSRPAPAQPQLLQLTRLPIPAHTCPPGTSLTAEMLCICCARARA